MRNAAAEASAPRTTPRKRNIGSTGLSNAMMDPCCRTTALLRADALQEVLNLLHRVVDLDVHRHLAVLDVGLGAVARDARRDRPRRVWIRRIRHRLGDREQIEPGVGV